MLKKAGAEPMNPVTLLHQFALFLCMRIGLSKWFLLAKVQGDFESSSALLDLKGGQKLLLVFGVLLLPVLCQAQWQAAGSLACLLPAGVRKARSGSRAQ